MNSYDYQKSDATRYDLSRMVGTGTHPLALLVLYSIAYLLFFEIRLTCR